jgi:hypothetical protein
MQLKIDLIETINNEILIEIACLSFNLKFKKEDFHNPIFIKKYNYWLIETKEGNNNTAVNNKFDVDCVQDGIRVKTYNQQQIHKILK